MTSHLATRYPNYCQYCHIATVMSEHQEKCPKFPPRCEYCKQQVLQGDMDEHRKKCASDMNSRLMLLQIGISVLCVLSLVVHLYSFQHCQSRVDELERTIKENKRNYCIIL